MNSKLESILPKSVEHRLQNERKRIEGGAFSSSLGVPENLLARQSGYQVLGQVMGATVYQVGWQWSNPNWRNNNAYIQRTEGISFEMSQLSQALMNARELAVSRLRAEAQILGADGVVGVHLSLRKPEYVGQNQIEFLAVGTAVKSSHAGEQKRGGAPFTSNLSVEEAWALESAGYIPCDFVMGNCVMLQTMATNTQNRMGLTILSGARGNFEVTEYTGAIYTAREIAVSRLERAAKQSGAQGIVGVKVEVEEVKGFTTVNSNSNDNTPHEIFGFTATGTAVKPLKKPTTRDSAITTVINLT